MEYYANQKSLQLIGFNTISILVMGSLAANVFYGLLIELNILAVISVLLFIFEFSSEFLAQQ